MKVPQWTPAVVPARRTARIIVINVPTSVSCPSMLLRLKNRLLVRPLVVVLLVSLTGLCIAEEEVAVAKRTGGKKNTTATSVTATGHGQQLYDDYVQAILERNCYQCHSHQAGEAQGGLVLDSSTGMLAGGENGTVVVPGNAAASRLVIAITYKDDDLQMPPDGPLGEDEVAKLRDWIEHGAPHGGSGLGNNASEEDQEPLWSTESLQHAELPAVKDNEWPRDDVDRFVLARLESEGAHPVDDADRATLLRRVHLTLVGLPPTPTQINTFLTDERTFREAFASVVDSLLGSLEYGERWGRHWLDIARYADSNGAGSEANNTIDNAWRYRDYVIAAFNDDKPYDRFVIEQMAGEQLPYTSVEQRRSLIIATGFLQLGPKPFGEQSLEKFRLDVIDEQIDSLGKSLIGISLGCARCHDHKFDPFPTADYYALAGILSSTRTLKLDKHWRMSKAWIRVPLPIDPQMETILRDEHKARVAKLEKVHKAADAKKEKADERVTALKAMEDVDPAELAAAEKEFKQAKEEARKAKARFRVSRIESVVPSALAVEDKPKMVDEPIRIRGLPNNRGKKIPRQVPSLLGLSVQQQQPASEGTPEPVANRFKVPADASGRLQLARWLVDAEEGAGSLTARVIVNRVWRHIMGEGLVDTPDNFGRTGSLPSHPELLDHLTREFIDDGWSIKRLVRRLVLSRTFSLAAKKDEAAATVDPENRLLWRYQVRRLDVEVIRDSMLTVSGELDLTRGGPTLQFQGTISLSDEWVTVSRESPFFRRSVYLPLMRDEFDRDGETSQMLGILPLFDLANPSMVVGRRSTTTVPSQSLYLLNNQFIIDRAKAMAVRLLSDETLADEASRVDRLLLWTFGRPAADSERQTLGEYIARSTVDSKAENPEAKRLDAWTRLGQVLFSTTEFLTIK